MRIKRSPPKPVAAMTGEECARIRVRVLKMSQVEFAQALGIKTVTTISRWENGAVPIADDRASAIRLLVAKVKGDRNAAAAGAA